MKITIPRFYLKIPRDCFGLPPSENEFKPRKFSPQTQVKWVDRVITNEFKRPQPLLVSGHPHFIYRNIPIHSLAKIYYTVSCILNEAYIFKVEEGIISKVVGLDIAKLEMPRDQQIIYCPFTLLSHYQGK